MPIIEEIFNKNDINTRGNWLGWAAMSAIFVVRNSTSGKPQEIKVPPIKYLFVIGYNKFINIIYSKYNFVNDRPKEFPPDQYRSYSKQTCASGLNVNKVINGCVTDQYVISLWGHFTRDGPVRQPRDKG